MIIFIFDLRGSSGYVTITVAAGECYYLVSFSLRLEAR